MQESHFIQHIFYKLFCINFKKSSAKTFSNMIYFKISPYTFVSHKQRDISSLDFEFLRFTIENKGYSTKNIEGG